MAEVTVCEIGPSGMRHGSPAIGRCAICGRAFCATHWGRRGNTYYPDLCVLCLAQRDAKRAGPPTPGDSAATQP